MSGPDDTGQPADPSPLRGLFGSLRDRISPSASAAGSSSGKGQFSLLEAPNQRRASRIVAMQDFVARLRHEMARQQIRRGDPLTPLLVLLGEMLLHFTHLTEDHTKDLDALTDRLGFGIRLWADHARVLLTEGVKTARNDMREASTMLIRDAQGIRQEMLAQVERTEAAVREISRERQLVHAGVEQEAARLLTKAVRQRVGWLNRVEICCVALVFMGVIVIACMAADNRGYNRGMAAAATAENRFAAAVALDDDPRAADRWLDLIRWNRIFQVFTDCQLQDVGAGRVVRRACSFELWDEPPDDAPPVNIPSAGQPRLATPSPGIGLPAGTRRPPALLQRGLGPVEFH